MQEWSADVETLRAKDSTGPRTARAVLFFHELDAEIRARTDNDKDLDDVVRLLMQERRVDADDLREASQSVAGCELETLRSPLLR
jgi:predicted metalloprotease with PDZ domain